MEILIKIELEIIEFKKNAYKINLYFYLYSIFGK